MQTDRELLQMALDALEESKKHLTDQRRDKTIEALRARLAQGEPETVGYLTNALGDERIFTTKKINQYSQPIYTVPPQREWQGLTDEEIENCFEMSMFGTCRAIEAKLKEKNA